MKLIPALIVTLAAARDTVPFDFGWKHTSGLSKHPEPYGTEPPKNPDPGANPAEASMTYDASSWEDVVLPHDGLIASAPTQTGCPGGCSGKSYIQRKVLWYRKEFTFPTSWTGDDDEIWLDFEGAFRSTILWVNGEKVLTHASGYTPFRLRLDNITSIKMTGKNVITTFIDPDNGDSGGQEKGSGWWYEGGGLYRHVNMVKANKLHIAEDGVFAYSNITNSDDGLVAWNSGSPRRMTASSAILHTSVEVYNDEAKSGDFTAAFVLYDNTGKNVGTGTSAAATAPAGSSAIATAAIAVTDVKLWNSASPTMYTVSVTVSSGGAVVDSMNITTGFRSLHYDSTDGFALNGEHFKIRGFCDHTNFAVVGMAIPPRINLFRAQASRAVGGNGRRTSHNPPDPRLLDIYDRVGVVVMDENRLFDNNTAYVNNMGSLVKRDRNHPAVVIW
jgi:beta-galactosidase/beta-glucuronidase